METNKRVSLKTKIFLVLLVSNLSVILIVGCISYFSKRNALKEQVEDSLSIMSEELADKIDRYLNQRLADTRAIALHYSLHGLKSTTSNQNRILAQYLRIYPFYDHISIINTEDIKIPTETEQAAEKQNIWYLPAMKGHITSSDMYISPLTDEPTMSFAAPVTDESGKVVSIITTNLRLDSLWDMVDRVHAENIKKKLSSYAFLINKDGYIIAHPNKEKILKENPLRDGKDARLRAMISQMTEGKAGTASYEYEGITKVAAYSPCKGYGQYKGHGWSVGVTEPYSELFAPMNRLLMIYILMFFLTFLATLYASSRLAVYLIRPILALKEAAAKVGGGNFSLRIEEGAEDEIGDLAISFNKMAETLEGRDNQIKEYTRTLTQINSELGIKQEELSLANQHLKVTNEELIKLEKQKDEFMAMITHDIKSPLSTVISYTEMMMDGTIKLGGDESSKAISSIQASGYKILSLVDNYLVSSAIEAKKLTLSPQPLDLNLFVEGEIPFFKPQMEKKNIKFIFNKAATMPKVMADKIQLDRAFSNIMSNALKFTPPNAEITVSTLLLEKEAAIAVSDTGGGISEDEIDGLFNKYRRSKNTAKIEGMGLGLFISKAIAEAHGGRLTAESRLGEGSTFTIYLPLKG